MCGGGANLHIHRTFKGVVFHSSYFKEKTHKYVILVNKDEF